MSSGVWFDFFLTEPVHRFAIHDPDDIEVVVLLVIVGAAVGEIALWGLRQGEHAARRRGYLDGVLETADFAAAEGTSPEELGRRIGDRIVSVLEVDHCRFVVGDVPPRAAPLLLRDGSVRRDGSVIAVAVTGCRSTARPCSRHPLPTATSESRRPVESPARAASSEGWPSSSRTSSPRVQPVPTRTAPRAHPCGVNRRPPRSPTLAGAARSGPKGAGHGTSW